MNNEIGRKITSLTLMTIMLAGGMTVVAPSMMPAAHAANANLFVSAENSQFNNYMSGPQVIEVVVIDSTINDTDQGKGEPDVKVNGKKLRMAQAVDGNWYGYFADRTQASIADFTAQGAGGVQGQGLNFGTLCAATSTTFGATFFSDTTGFAIPSREPSGQNGTAAGTVTAVCNALSGNANGTSGIAMNVVREAKDLNTNTAVAVGQIGLGGTRTAASLTGVWPIVQLYDLSVGGNVIVSYNKGGGVQSTTLTFDTVDQFAKIDLDKTKYTQKSQVHATLTDLWLNIDPTDEDSWTFGTNATNTLSTNYQIFNENGGLAGAGVAKGIINIKGNLTSLMIETNGILKMDADKQNSGTAVLTLQDNDDSDLDTCSQDAKTCTATNSALFGLGINTQPITITEQGPNTGIFGTYDESDKSAIIITDAAKRGTSATIDYNEVPRTVLVGFDFATISITPTDGEWNSGEEIPITLVDGDANKNSRADEDLDVNDPNVTLIPALITGDPFTLGENGTGLTNAQKGVWINFTGTTGTGIISSLHGSPNATATINVQKFSERAIVSNSTSIEPRFANALVVELGTTIGDLRQTIRNPDAGNTFHGFNFLNLDLRSFNTTSTFDVYLLNSTTANGRIITSAGVTNTGVGALLIADNVSPQSLTQLNATTSNARIFAAATASTNHVGLLFVNNGGNLVLPSTSDAIVADFFSYGFLNDGLKESERIANQIIRFELEETGDNTSTFAGTVEYIMLNQLNILDTTTYSNLSPIADDPTFIVIEDLDDEDSPRVNYNDLGADGVTTQVSVQQAAPAHSGIVSFNSHNFKTADTVTVTVQDVDLNVDSDLIDIYTVVSNAGTLKDVVGKNSTSIRLSNGDDLGRLLDITFDDKTWRSPTVTACATSLSNAGVTDTGLGATGFTLVETGPATGTFVGDFQIPSLWCAPSATTATTVTGLDIEVNYVDYRDASGETIEVGDSAGVRANTGSVSLDRTVYPVPFGIPSDFAAQSTTTTPNGRSIFPIHQTGMSVSPQPTGFTAALDSGEFLTNGDLTIHVRVNDPDFDVSASGEDKIGQNTTSATKPVGPVKVSVLRGSSVVVLGYAGGDAVLPGRIDVADNNANATRQFGPMTEIAPDAGIFEADIVVRYTDGPESTICPTTSDFAPINGATDGAANPVTDRFDAASTSGTNYCILQGDILQVEYTDPADASGDINTVTDSATFDLRNGVLQSDKSVYIIGSDMILTLIEPDFDLDNQGAETYNLDLIEWDSDAATVTMGNRGGNSANFDPEPFNFRETGDSTGIFQIVVEIPDTLGNDKLERGEEIDLEYSDWGPSGSDYVGDEDQDVKLTIFTSNFGATVALDQKVYSWTDKVYITIVAPDHNFDSNLIDDVGNTSDDPIKVATRSAKLSNYKLVETGTDTGIFTGEVILTGFTHDADGDPTTGPSGNDVTSTSASGSGPTSGKLPATDNDGLTVSFEFSEDETVVGSALIRWNIGEVQWLEASYPAKGTGVVRIIDPDMNLNPESVDNFNANVWSDSDAGGIDLTVTETNEATGIFEGTVFFTVSDESSGHRLRVAEGDTVTAEYEDNTLPSPYTTADELRITATTLIGTIVPPLERAPAANLRVVDAFGNSLSAVNVDQQVQITADLANGQDKKQVFAYLVQIQDGNGVTVSLAWITGALSAGQSFSPALSWIPTEAGTYTATAFVWESVDNPTALSPPVSTTITVQ
ncbi:conserved exported hypothetical protein [metagenome]